MEFQLIQKYFSEALFKQSHKDVVLAGGDDCAILQCDSNYQLAVSVDTLTESVHFPAECPAHWVAARALRSNLSDLAACGAEPFAFTLAISLPDILVQHYPDWLQTFATQLANDSENFNIDLIGGDTTSGPLSITIQVLGKIPNGQALLRSGAKVGDDIYVTGTLGDAAAWLEYPDNDDFLQQYVYPEPRLAFAQQLHGIARSCLDISDGLLADLSHICEASGVAAEIDVEKLPLSQQLQKLPNAVELALCGGDDYELCFSCDAKFADQLQALALQENIKLSRIGQIVARQSAQTNLVRVYQEGSELILERRGYEHFS